MRGLSCLSCVMLASQTSFPDRGLAIAPASEGQVTEYSLWRFLCSCATDVRLPRSQPRPWPPPSLAFCHLPLHLCHLSLHLCRLLGCWQRWWHGFLHSQHGRWDHDDGRGLVVFKNWDKLALPTTSKQQSCARRMWQGGTYVSLYEQRCPTLQPRRVHLDLPAIGQLTLVHERNYL